MVASFVVDVKDAEIKRMFRRLGPAKDRAVSRGVNKITTQTRTESSKAIRQRERSLKAGVVRKALYIERSKPRTLRAVIRASGRPIPLRDFKGTRFTRGRGRGKGRRGSVVAQVIPGQKKTVQGAFIGPGGHVFRRRGRSRLPIEKLYGPTIPSGFVKRTITSAMQNKARRVGRRVIETELRFELSKVA